MTAQKLRDLAFSAYGCTGFHAASEGDLEIAISYWPSLEAINEWKKDLEHMEAQAKGRQKWYSWYKVDVAKVERSYGYPADEK